MSKECKQARNIVSTAFVILLILIAIMSMSSCGSVNYCGKKELRKCCKETAQAVYEYEGLIVK